MTTPLTHPNNHERLFIGLALASLYLIWGTTYLGIKWAVEGFPPFLMGAIRFMAAGVLLLLFLWLNKAPLPTARQWRNSAIVGLFLMGGGMGLVALGQSMGVASGLAATIVASGPMWISLFAGLSGQWPVRMEWVGMVLGLAGVGFLSLEGNLQANPLAMLLVVLAPICWSAGSILSRKVDMPLGLMASASGMLMGGVVMLGISLLSGERLSAVPALKSWLALGYLTVFGSIIAYSAYMYVLARVRPTIATSYTYINPIIAVLLGVWLDREPIGAWAWVGLAVILLGVGIIATARHRGQSGKGLS
jgi:drug/metabolite transporter (DMT)-like permease